MIPNSIKNIYYRGSLKSCNYSCDYCPFSKNKISLRQLENDKKSLNKFVQEIRDNKNISSIMFVPYGEALIHEYYWEAIIYLAKLKQIKTIGCQTNLTLNIPNFIQKLNQSNINISKIKLWCSFHPSMVSTKQFIQQCNLLYNNKIDFCVGAVADYQNINTLNNLKVSLPPSVYMWLNYKDGLIRKYYDYEIEAFKNIDALFDLEIKKPKSDISLCVGGKENIFINSQGNIYACNMSKIKLGNIYFNEFNSVSCGADTCSCYLSYSNRIDLPMLNYFGENKLIRCYKK